MASCADTRLRRAACPLGMGRRPKPLPAKCSLALVAVLVLLTTGLTGCAFTGASGSQNPSQALGNLSAPANLAFGNVAVGSTTDQTITLSNSGSTSISVTQATFSNSSFSAPGLTLPMTVGAGQNAVFQIQFAPHATGDSDGTLSVSSNASNSPLSISLTGAGTQGQLGASPSSISFGNVNVDGSGSQTVTLSNSGNATLTISQATASGAGFSLSGLS